MLFYPPLISGRLIQRYKRFLADVTLEDGSVITVHCPNSGSMMGLKEPGSRVWLSKAPEGSKRKYAHTWEIVEVADFLVGVHTTLANHVVKDALQKGLIEPLKAYTQQRAEVPYGQNSRIDFLLQEPGLPDFYLEVKSVTLQRNGLAQFPDAVTSRGTKHLGELSRMCQAGAKAGVLYLVLRGDTTGFHLAADIDPTYAKAHEAAMMTGVISLCYVCDVQKEGLTFQGPLPFVVQQENP
jgi:sugar fermentation stimulation protein A